MERSIRFAWVPTLALAALVQLAAVPRAQAQSTPFTYQGRLWMDGAPVNEQCDFKFRLYDSEGGVTQIGSEDDHNGVQVSDGLFTVDLDFDEPAAFDGDDERWLEIEVQVLGQPNFVLLDQRQQINAAPKAMFAKKAKRLELPYSDTADLNGCAFEVKNTNADGKAICGEASGKNGRAVAGRVTSQDPNGFPYAGYFESEAPNGAAVVGIANRQTGTGVQGWGPNGGVGCSGNSTTGIGVAGDSTSNFGVFGRSSSGYGVEGVSFSSIGVRGVCSGNDYGVYGTSVTGTAVGGDSSTGHGVVGSTSAVNRFGVFGSNSAGGGIGVEGFCSAGVGVEGQSDIGTGVFGKGGSGGVYGQSTSGSGVQGVSGTGYGVRGDSTSFPGVAGVSDSNYGVQGVSSTSVGVHGRSNSSTGVFGTSTTGLAGHFFGNVYVQGTLSKNAGAFKIDHPLDPANMYLSHSFVESPDMMNIYNGNVVTDGRGYATIALPDWFEALNRDFRYQLTVLDEEDGDTFVQAKVVGKVQGNQFTIRTSSPAVEVSWQVTGIRRDAWAEAHRIVVEEDKPDAERGKYLQPELYGQPAEMGVFYHPDNVDEAEAAEPISTDADSDEEGGEYDVNS